MITLNARGGVVASVRSLALALALDAAACADARDTPKTPQATADTVGAIPDELPAGQFTPGPGITPDSPGPLPDDASPENTSGMHQAGTGGVAAPNDAATPDAAGSAPMNDASPLDAATSDAATSDGSAGDAGALDAATVDASPHDAAAVDAAPPDAAVDASPGGDASHDAGGTGGTPTYLNAGDCHPGVHIEPDRLSVEWRTIGTAGVRSTRAIAPGEGVFYFEATTWAALDALTIGVATAAQPLDQLAGSSDRSFGVDPSGDIYSGGVRVAGFDTDGRSFGFVLDYRASHPVVHVIAEAGGSPRIIHSGSLLAVADPLFIYLAGMRRIPETHLTVNAGNDTADWPFAFEPRALLRAAGLSAAADALVPGWGATHAGVYNRPPVVTAPAGVSVSAGTPVTLSAQADDAEDGALDGVLLWEVLSSGYGPERVQGTGASFTFTPGVLGVHPVRITAVDSGGKRDRAVVDVRASGQLTQHRDVRMVADPLSGSGIVVASDGLRVRWTVHAKNAIRANQGLYGGFWYFESHRLIAPANQAPGLVIGGVSLDPLPFNVTPPSCSVNTAGGVFQNLMYRAPLSEAEVEYYGFAVDYRGRYPIVYVLLDGALASTLHLKDATVPIYPMLYGNPTGAGAEWDIAINFGGEPFHYDPAAALTAAGVDASALVPCWGVANAACP
jgi:hypothetical protein